MPDKTTHHTSEITHNHPHSKGSHPALKWIIALIIGLLCSLVLMLFIVADLIQQAGGIGTDLVFRSFFLYTGGLVLLQQASESILMFLAATAYYFVFFTLIGLIIGYIVEFLVKTVRRD